LILKIYDCDIVIGIRFHILFLLINLYYSFSSSPISL